MLHLDPVLEPDQACWAVLHVLVDGATMTDTVDLRGVISVLDAGSLLTYATSEQDVAERAGAASINMVGSRSAQTSLWRGAGHTGGGATALG